MRLAVFVVVVISLYLIAVFAHPHETPGVSMVGYPAPDWSGEAVVKGEFKTVGLEEYKGKWLVMVFYPLDFTFVCPTELVSFSDRVDDFRSLNAEIVALSVDSKHSHYAWTQVPRNKGGLGDIKYPLVGDITKKIARQYGVLYKETGNTVRGLFVIDPNGIVRQITLNDDQIGRSIDEVLRLLKGLQHADKHGVVCPANWKPGDDDLIPDQVKKTEYFQKKY